MPSKYDFACTHTCTENDTDKDSTNNWGYVYILGGDSFVKTTDEAAGERGGGYMNDVWVSEGAGWEVYSDGSKPMAMSTMPWDEINPGRIPPAGLTYEDWIVCQARRRGFGCSRVRGRNEWGESETGDKRETAQYR